MLLPLLSLLAWYVDVACVTKIEDISICVNETDCGEAADSITYTLEPRGMNETSNDTSGNAEGLDDGATASPEQTTTGKAVANATERPDQNAILTASAPGVATFASGKTLALERREICECDLTRFSCDVNCCCDGDCSEFHLSSFSHCEKQGAESYDSRYCYNRNFIQRNNTPYILDKLASNLFCILYDNLPSTYSTYDHLVIQGEKDLWQTVDARKYQWNVENGKTLAKYNLSKHYQYGAILWKLHDKSVKPIELLQSGFSGTCSLKKIVKYLENWEGTCLQHQLSSANQNLFPATFSNFTVIASPPLLNKTSLTEQVCSSNVCLPIRTHYCPYSFSNCNQMEVPVLCANSSCANVVRGVKYVISHNGSVGIDSVDAYFHIGDASKPFYQRFTVRYDWTSSNGTRVPIGNGNAGYTLGQPIVIGAARTNGSGEIVFNVTDGVLALPAADKDGECGNGRHIVTFGDRVKLRCSVELPTVNFNASACALLQNRTLDLLAGHYPRDGDQRYSAYVSKSNNFSSANAADWTRIAFDRTPRGVVTARAIGRRILCSGLVTSAHLHVFYARGSRGTATGHVIAGAGVAFAKEEDVSWTKCPAENCTDVLRVDVTSYISFHDVSKPFKYHFVGGPNLDITLPYDFFYPFLYSSAPMLAPGLLLVASLVANAALCRTEI